MQMENPARYGTIPEPNSCHATAMPDQTSTKNKLFLHCSTQEPRPLQHFCAIHSKHLTPWGSPTYTNSLQYLTPWGSPTWKQLYCTFLLYILFLSFLISFFVFLFISSFLSFLCLFYLFLLSLLPPKLLHPLFLNISPKGIPFLRH